MSDTATNPTRFTYDGHEVRVVTGPDSEPWFVATDVARALGYLNPADAVRRVDRRDRLQVVLAQGEGHLEVLRERAVVSEYGVYELVLGSPLPGAREFRHWVTHEVLPAVRRQAGAGGRPVPTAGTGPAHAPVLFESPEFGHVRTVERQRDELADQAARSATKVLFADAVSASRSTVLVGDLAKILRGNGLDIGANRLFDLLRRHGYLVSRRGTDWNMPTQKAMELGLFKVKETVVTHSDGHVTVSRTPKVTGRGQAYLVPRILDGRIPVEDDARQTP